MSKAVIASPLGNIAITEEGGQITTIQFTSEDVLVMTNPVLEEAVSQLKEYFAGERREFKLDVKPKGTEFQLKVWTELQNIPFGQTISYLELANRLGDPNCIRAAASANGKNPVAIVIPCHRVIGSDGSMKGYAGGIEKKERLLELEGADMMNQLNIF